MPIVSAALCCSTICCQRCALPFDHDVETGSGQLPEIAARFDEAVAGLRYTDTARQLILAFKHGDRLDIAPLLARVMLPRAMPLISKADLVLPVPCTGGGFPQTL